MSKAASNVAMTAVIADDEENLRQYLGRLLARVWPALRVVGEAANGREALAQIRQLAPDVVFLDIRMPGISGIEVAREVPGDTRVVFVTAFDDYAIEAFEQAAVDYLLKPVDESRLRRTVERLAVPAAGPPDMSTLVRLLDDAGLRRSQWLNWVRVGVQGETRIVPITDIAYFKADQKYTSVRTLEAEYLIRKSIKELEAELDPEQFWRVHRSTLVNLAYLEAAKRDFRGRYTLRLKGLDDTLRVSDTYTHLFRQM